MVGLTKRAYAARGGKSAAKIPPKKMSAIVKDYKSGKPAPIVGRSEFKSMTPAQQAEKTQPRKPRALSVRPLWQ